LRAALRLFREFGAEAFAGRTQIELEATGERIRPPAADAKAQLTPQESQVARLAGQGLTNREIAARLFIGQSAVEYHLVLQRRPVTWAAAAPRHYLVNFSGPVGFSCLDE
jgi:DNA-binding NarL/FixJ family response regulator